MGSEMCIRDRVMAIANYPIYKGILTGRRKKYAQQIIALSDRLTKGSGRA